MSLRWNSTITGLILETDLIHVSEAPNIESVLELIGTQFRTLYVTREVPIKNTVTIPENISVIVTRNGSFKIDSGKILTLDGTLIAGAYQIFTGDGTVVLNRNSADFVRSAWWGADAAADTSARSSIISGNALMLASADSGSNPKLSAIGQDTDIGIDLEVKGSSLSSPKIDKGSATLSSGTVPVSHAVKLPYKILLSWDDNTTVYWSNKEDNTFDLNSPDVSVTTNVDWIVVQG